MLLHHHLAAALIGEQGSVQLARAEARRLARDAGPAQPARPAWAALVRRLRASDRHVACGS